jgi:hypothetical protein
MLQSSDRETNRFLREFANSPKTDLDGQLQRFARAFLHFLDTPQSPPISNQPRQILPWFDGLKSFFDSVTITSVSPETIDQWNRVFKFLLRFGTDPHIGVMCLEFFLRVVLSLQEVSSPASWQPSFSSLVLSMSNLFFDSFLDFLCRFTKLVKVDFWWSLVCLTIPSQDPQRLSRFVEIAAAVPGARFLDPRNPKSISFALTLIQSAPTESEKLKLLRTLLVPSFPMYLVSVGDPQCLSSFKAKFADKGRDYCLMLLDCARKGDGRNLAVIMQLLAFLVNKCPVPPPRQFGEANEWLTALLRFRKVLRLIYKID